MFEKQHFVSGRGVVANVMAYYSTQLGFDSRCGEYICLYPLARQCKISQ